MDQRQIELVQVSFARAARLGAHVAATFYAELFAIDSSLKSLFTGDMIVQGEKLMSMLAQVVRALPEPESILDEARALAVRHVAYGVEEGHYALVETALLRTLRHELAGDFTPETRAAWTEAYQLLSGTMKAAAYQAPLPTR
jgi:nitric oxide dioxygenase